MYPQLVSDTQGQVTPKLMVGSDRNSKSSEIVYLPLLPKSLMKIQSKMLSCPQHFLHYKSSGKSFGGQGRVAPKVIVRSSWKSNSAQMLPLSSILASLTKFRSNINHSISPVICLYELLVAMETRVLICSPLPFTNLNDATHRIWSRLVNWSWRYSSLKVWTTMTTTTDDLQTIGYKLTLWAFGSGELNQSWKHYRKTSVWTYTYFRHCSNEKEYEDIHGRGTGNSLPGHQYLLSSYLGLSNLICGVMAAPQRGYFKLLHVPSNVRYTAFRSHILG